MIVFQVIDIISIQHKYIDVLFIEILCASILYFPLTLVRPHRREVRYFYLLCTTLVIFITVVSGFDFVFWSVMFGKEQWFTKKINCVQFFFNVFTEETNKM